MAARLLSFTDFLPTLWVSFNAWELGLSSHQDRLIHWLLGGLELETTLFHLGQYCGSWQASISGLARSGFHLVLGGQCWLHLPGGVAPRLLQTGDAVFFLRDTPHTLSPVTDPVVAAQAPRVAMQALDASVADGVALACGFFEFRSALNRVFLESFPDYVVIPAQGAELAELRPLFDLILIEAKTSGQEPSPLIERLVGLLFFYVIRHLCLRQEVSTRPTIRTGSLAAGLRPSIRIRSNSGRNSADSRRITIVVRERLRAPPARAKFEEAAGQPRHRPPMRPAPAWRHAVPAQPPPGRHRAQGLRRVSRKRNTRIPGSTNAGPHHRHAGVRSATRPPDEGRACQPEIDACPRRHCPR